MLDRLRIVWAFWTHTGRLPNLRHPTTYREHIQVAKLTWRSPLLATVVDKVAVKHLIAEHFGADWLIPTLYAGSTLPPMAERALWPTPFVIKSNASSGRNIFVRGVPDWPEIERRIAKFNRRGTYGKRLGEWAYSQIAPQFLVEPLIGGGQISPPDYKFFVFGGRVETIQLDENRGTDQSSALMLGRDWAALDFQRGSYPPPQNRSPTPPASLARMIAFAEEVGRRFPFVRVDLYEVDGRPLFGEITIYPGSGHERLSPERWDAYWGSLWPPGLPANYWTDVAP